MLRQRRVADALIKACLENVTIYVHGTKNLNSQLRNLRCALPRKGFAFNFGPRKVSHYLLELPIEANSVLITVPIPE